MSTYRIQSGDCLSVLAERFHTSVQALQQANPKITNPDLIYTGDTLNIPGSADTFEPAPQGQTPPGMPPLGSPPPGDVRSPIPGASQALAWARQFLGTRQYEDLCGSFCYKAYQLGAGRNLSSEWNANTAGEICNNLERSGKLRAYDPSQPPPPGAILFYRANGNNSGFGHVVLCTENPNEVISTGWPSPPTPVKTWSIAALSAAEGEQPAGWIIP